MAKRCGNNEKWRSIKSACLCEVVLCCGKRLQCTYIHAYKQYTHTYLPYSACDCGCCDVLPLKSLRSSRRLKREFTATTASTQQARPNAKICPDRNYRRCHNLSAQKGRVKRTFSRRCAEGRICCCFSSCNVLSIR